MKLQTTVLSLFITLAIQAQTYQSAESIEFDTINGGWLVANGSNIVRDDGQGNLSFFGTGSASHGMEIMGNTLFVIDSNVIRGYDLTSETQVMSLNIPGVSFLNGMTSDAVDQLWVTDFGASKIYNIDVSDFNNPLATEIVSNTGATPNGILYDDTRLLFVTWGASAAIKAVDLTTNVVTDIVADTGLANIDGIIKNDSGSYIISSWTPAVLTRYTDNFTVSNTVLSPALMNPADIGVNLDVVAVPMGNNVVFVETEVLIGIEEFDLNSINFTISQNPVTPKTIVLFDLKEMQDVNIGVYDFSGNLLSTLYDEKQQQGFKQIPLKINSTVSTGMYFLKVSVGDHAALKKILVK